ncbi:MAG: hypothetical protein ACO3B3_03865 [Cyanobium sp.]
MDDAPIILNLAISQADRSARAPDPSRVMADDRSLSQLLQLAIEHGKLIRFFDLNEAPDGDWSDLFAHDPAIALASQACLDPAQVKREMQRIGRQLRVDHQPLVRMQPWRELVALIRQLLTILRRRPLRDGPLAMVLQEVDQSMPLSEAAQALGLFLESTGLDLRLGSKDILLKDSELRRLENLLRDFLGVLLSELDATRRVAETNLMIELGRKGHAPHIALYIAFARLFQSLQSRLNCFPANLIDFYHQQILHQDSIADTTHQPDRLSLSFRPKPDETQVLVPRQTLISAGEDGEGQPILFATDQDLVAQPYDIAGLRTLRVIAHGAKGESGQAAIKAIWVTDFALPLPYPATAPLLPLFGSDEPKSTVNGSVSRGLIGLAIASPLLRMECGQREARLILKVTPKSLAELQSCLNTTDSTSLLEDIRCALEQDLTWEHSTSAGFAPLLANAQLSKPGDGGAEELAIELRFNLAPSAPAWCAWPPKGALPLLLGRHRDPEQPAVEATPPATGGPEKVPALTVLSLLKLESLELMVEVKELQPTDLQSTAGSLDPAQPLPIFGAAPVRGSVFTALADELENKPLQEISLQLFWHGLPISRDGFRGHYKGYLLDGDGQSHPPGELFNNDCFRATLALALNPASTDLETASSEQALFTGDNVIAPSTELKLSNLKGVLGVNGLRLVLSGPAHAFGDGLYASNCLEASRRLIPTTPPANQSNNQPATQSTIQPAIQSDHPWPNPPWCPKAERVTLEYRCTTTIATSAKPEQAASQLLHLSPLLDDLVPARWGPGEGVPLLPALLSDGNSEERTILLTLSRPLNQLSLLFGLATTATVEPLAANQKMGVEVWNGQTWITLAEGVQDGTSALSRTGILQLFLQDSQTSFRFRLRINGPGNAQPELICLEPNAVWATWQGPGGKQLLNRSRPANTVTTMASAMVGIESVRQPLPSSGGLQPATTTLEKVRLAERLRHKDRAIQPDDYALLLLSAFPSLWQVAVLPARNSEGKIEPGCVTIIPIPGPDSPTIPDTTTPCCDAALGDRILAELQARVSPFAQLRVASPPYCAITVRATVVVMDETRVDTLLEQLQKDLVRYLSPWPDPDLAVRPKAYYSETAVGQFIRERSYIKSIGVLQLEYKLPDTPPVYYTSAKRHQLTARPSSSSAAPIMEGLRSE